MKKLITIVLSIITSVGLQAQPQQGSIRLSGSLKFDASSSEFKNGTTVDGPKTSHYTVNPCGSYFINDKFEVGLGIGISGEKEEDANSFGTSEYTSSLFMVMPFAQYNGMINEKLFCTGRGMVDVGFGSYEDKFTDTSGSTTQKGDISSFSVGLTPGLEYWPSEKISINFQLGDLSYTSTTQKADAGGEFTENDFRFKYGAKRVGVGASYLFGGNAK